MQEERTSAVREKRVSCWPLLQQIAQANKTLNVGPPLRWWPTYRHTHKTVTDHRGWLDSPKPDTIFARCWMKLWMPFGSLWPNTRIKQIMKLAQLFSDFEELQTSPLCLSQPKNSSFTDFCLCSSKQEKRKATKKFTSSYVFNKTGSSTILVTQTFELQLKVDKVVWFFVQKQKSGNQPWGRKSWG